MLQKYCDTVVNLHGGKESSADSFQERWLGNYPPIYLNVLLNRTLKNERMLNQGIISTSAQISMDHEMFVNTKEKLALELANQVYHYFLFCLKK